jgi:Protein of unknown function (DUF2786)
VQTSKEHLDNTIKKIHDLLARADHPNTPLPEAETARAMAERLMDQYRIEEKHLVDSGQLSLSPQWQTFTVCRYMSEFAQSYRAMASWVFHHLGIRAVFFVAGGDDGSEYVAKMVGFESDLRFAEMLYTQAQVGFQAKLEPKFNPDLSNQENAYIMRSAGMEGWRIAQAIFGRDDRALRPKVRAMFRDEAIKRGEDPTILLGKGNSVKVFRQSYAEGFTNELYYILARMARDRSEEGSIVLVSREEMINEAFYKEYPQYRPAHIKHSAAAYTDPRENCERCKKAKSGYCRDHLWLKPRMTRETRTNYDGLRKGKAAAQDLDLGLQKERRSGKLEGSGIQPNKEIE